MTLIEVGHSNGDRRRCDASCYDAQGDRCVCVCGGRNHGVGLQRAQVNTAQLAQQELAALIAAGAVTIPPAALAQQIDLFHGREVTP